jgi:hypothetical protein
MHKFVLAALALSPLFGGVALAGESPFVDHSVGPAAYTDWQAQWARVRNNHDAQSGWVPGQQSPGAQPASNVTQPDSAKPNG